MSTTRERVKLLRMADPAMPAAEIARRVGVSRQRVHALLRALGLPTAVPLCAKCGAAITTKADDVHQAIRVNS